jgi:hypothetical protein
MKSPLLSFSNSDRQPTALRTQGIAAVSFEGLGR